MTEAELKALPFQQKRKLQSLIEKGGRIIKKNENDDVVILLGERSYHVDKNGNAR